MNILSCPTNMSFKKHLVFLCLCDVGEPALGSLSLHPRSQWWGQVILLPWASEPFRPWGNRDNNTLKIIEELDEITLNPSMLSSISIFHLLEKLKKKTKLRFFALHTMPDRHGSCRIINKQLGQLSLECFLSLAAQIRCVQTEACFANKYARN